MLWLLRLLLHQLRRRKRVMMIWAWIFSVKSDRFVRMDLVVIFLK